MTPYRISRGVELDMSSTAIIPRGLHGPISKWIVALSDYPLPMTVPCGVDQQLPSVSGEWMVLACFVVPAAAGRLG